MKHPGAQTVEATQPSGQPARRARRQLLAKYITIFAAVVAIALVSSGALEIWFSYNEYKASLVRIQREQAESAAAKIAQFIREIESQVGWTTQLPWSTGTLEQRRFDALRLLRQVPAITELAQLDPTGHELLRVSRLAMDVIGSNADYSADPKFTEAVARKVYYGPVYFRRESEPYMTLSLAGTRRDAGVSVAEVNLKFIWDVVSQIKVGERGKAYVVDAKGRLIAHPDISLVLRNSDLSNLEQVKAARSGREEAPVTEAADFQGQVVLTAFAPVSDLGWLIFVDLPVAEAYAPLYSSLQRTAVLLMGGLLLALLAGFFLARRMVGPIRTLREGAARIGGGDLAQRISIRTGDELESLADQFNDMAARLADSYADLEKKVEIRTRELEQSNSELRALGEVSRAVNSTLDLETVLETIVTKAVQLSGTDGGAIYVLNDAKHEYELRATCGMSEELIAAVGSHHAEFSEAVARTVELRVPTQVPDLEENAASPVTDVMLHAGFRARLVVPLVGAERAVGALVVRRKAPGAFPASTIELLQTFAAQSVLAIENANLFHEIEAKSRELQLASQHKSQFLANMSHELRTPLNAILGYTELILDNVYGEVPARVTATLARVQSNGRHLLGLINDVLDLSKIEAGQLQLTLGDYSVKDVVHNVFSAVESLASNKNIRLKVDIAPELPAARGDERRLTQVLLNLVGNAIKFTDTGEVAIKASNSNGNFTIAVRDTGPGISEADQAKIFEEFQQADSSTTKEKGGTGLGLAIARSIIEMHGGRLWVESKVGEGSTFIFTVPTIVETQASA
ncbi:MAG TPA: ATP-binding protein [Burkholderiales bacterium]|nr:ATP-binding protein [Burkholderiales bacterium]